MQISALRQQTSERLAAFAWDRWAQLGVLATTDGRDRAAADPEALILLTLEVGRDEPRLFDELLDWLVVNERLISVQRARNLAVDIEDRRLLDAALGWVAQRRRVAHVKPPGATAPESARAAAVPLFRGMSGPVTTADDAFLAHGLLRGRVEPRRHSRAPNLGDSIAFDFRLRQLLGVGARAEVARTLLTTEAPWLTAGVVAESAGYAKRNVQEALSSLDAAGVVNEVAVANEHRYSAPRERWASLLGLEAHELPAHRDWPQLLLAMRRVLRWLHDPVHAEESDYLRASAARELMAEVAPLLRYAGVPARDGTGRGAEYWPQFVATVKDATRALEDGVA